MEMAVLKYLLEADQRNSAELFSTLATLIQAAVPDRAVVEYYGFFWQKNRPVKSITVSFADMTYELTISKSGAVTTSEQKFVRNVRLRTDTITMEHCLKGIVSRLAAMEQASAATKAAIEAFVRGR